MRRVVVTGMGVVSPVGNDVPSFWESLKGGKCGIDFISKFDAEGFKAKVAAEVKGFDPLNYGLEKQKTRRMDLYTQYALSAAVQAMRDSDLSGVAPERLGVYVGSGIGGLHTLVTENNKYMERGPGRVSPFFIPMMIANIAAGSIAIEFQAKGPSLPVVTACATSTNAVGEAYRAIKHGYADAIIAGGTEATIEPLAVAGFVNCMALSLSGDPKESSLPFDARRNGFVMGEGAGILVLEEYENAKKRGAKIYGEICGYGNTCDAYHVTAPSPDAEGAARAIQLALEEAGYTAGDKVYINAHGTGTKLNDAAETIAIKKALKEEAGRALVSSTKSMTGHMLGAAGAVEAIASLLALKEGVVPPTIGLFKPDPECDLDYVPQKSRKAELTLALSTSLGFGGHNGCLAFRTV